jgi:hypothetical protein
MRKPYLVALVVAPVVPLAAIIGRHAEDIAMLSVRPVAVAKVAKVARRTPPPVRVARRPQPPRPSPPPSPRLSLPPPPPRRLLRPPCADDPCEVKRIFKRMQGPLGVPQVERLVGRGDDHEMTADNPGV